MMPRRTRIWSICVLGGLAAIVIGGCGGGGSKTASAPPPDVDPPSKEQILEQRQAKDTRFARSDDSPIPPALREDFTGLRYYPFDEEWQLLVRLERRDEPKPFTITTTEGAQRPAVTIGKIRFERGGDEHTLNVYSLRDLPADAWDSLFLPFMDETTGDETYPAGRYIELEKVERGWYLLDFNQAYNPLCAYGRDIYRCPRTPPENSLPIAVRAGEKGWGVPGASRQQAAGGTGEPAAGG